MPVANTKAKKVGITSALLWYAAGGPPPWANIKKKPISGATPAPAAAPSPPSVPVVESAATAVAEAAPANGAPVAQTPIEEAKKRDGKPHEVTFTPEADAKILEMKAMSKGWKDIAHELGKPQWQVKNRFREISITQTPKPLKTEGVAETKADAAPAEVEEETVELKMSERVIFLQPDEVFNEDELVLLANLYYLDRSEQWLRISSAFYDRTGRRLHPLDVRDKLTERSAEEYSG